mgnify:FL=1|jgi:hypothetical protein
MYQRTFWRDRAVDQTGQVIQHGTLQDQAHFNNMEDGIADANLAAALQSFYDVQTGYENEAEVQTVTLTANSYPYPFCNNEKAVALRTLRNTTNYTVDVDVVSYAGGQLGDILVKDKALNGFKLLSDGSAKTITLRVKITGGMTA